MYNTKNRYEQGQALRKEIYMYIVSYIKLVGYAPSITEISERVDENQKEREITTGGTKNEVSGLFRRNRWI